MTSGCVILLIAACGYLMYFALY